MEKEKILEMSRKENKNKDIAEFEVEEKANTIAIIVGLAFAVVFMYWQACCDKGVNFSMVAMVEIILAVSYCYQYYRLKRKKHLLLAILFVLMAIAFTVAAIIGFYK